MRKGPFLPEDFLATKFSTGADKADFGNMLLHFVESNCKRELFTDRSDQRLSNCFGHIAHCDHETFYETWFKTDLDQLRFLKHTLAGRCWPDPKFTFSDVERAIQREIKGCGYLARYELRTEVAAHARDMETLQRLEAKYRSLSMRCPPDGEQPTTQYPDRSELGVIHTVPMQASLFELG